MATGKMAESAIDPMPPDGKADTTGRERILFNVIVGWVSQFVFLVAGFIIPRMINDHLGQESLGVWDFGWSLVAYFGLVQIGVVSSINRYVAKHRAVNDIHGVNIVVSSVFLVLICMALVVLAMTLGAFYCLPLFFASRLGAFISDAQWIVFFLGMSLVIQVLWSGYGGVLTGCHRWDLHHGINGGCRLFTLAGMAAVLLFGGGLVWLALVNLVGELIGLIARFFAAYRVCQGLAVRLQYIRKATIRNMLGFGAKTFLPHLGDLLSNQTISLVIVWFLGPAVLAFYSRPRSLIRHVQTFVVRYAFTFTPTASSIQAMQDRDSLRDLFIKANRYGAFIVLPAILILSIIGGTIVRFWMGPEYEDQLLISIMALGYMPVLLQLPALSILRGLNAHGKPGFVKLVAALVGAIGAAIVLGVFRLGLNAAICAVVFPLFISDGIYLSLFARKYIGMPIWAYIKASFFKPFLYMTPLLLLLIGVKMSFPNDPTLTLICGVGGSLLITVLIYWKLVYPIVVRSKFGKRAYVKK